MAYIDYVAPVTTGAINLSTVKKNISEIEFNTVWEGPAKEKQSTDFENLNSALETQISNIYIIAEILPLFDKYDKAIADAQYYAELRKNLSTDMMYYTETFNYYNDLVKENNQISSDTAETIRTKLASITSSYKEQLINKSAVDVVSTVDKFKEFEANISNISSSAFDLRNTVFAYSSLTEDKLKPDFNNLDAWVRQNPYASMNTGQCTWFAWGRFYEIYGYSPGFTGNGNQCAGQLLAAHGDKFYQSDTPVAGAVFSSGLNKRYGHVGIVLSVNEEAGTMVIQDGNYNGTTDTFAVAQSDWGTREVSIAGFGGGSVIYANPR